MKLKLGIIYGVLIWVVTHIIFNITHPIVISYIHHNTNILLAISIIIVSGFFSILYIREITENEVLEGILVGILFVLIDVILDFAFIIIPNNKIILFSNYTNHIMLMSIILILLPTFLGYLAQMNIELK